jgi:selenocysteine lyase/cysteine desulfurase
MYVAEPWRNARPLEESWISRDNALDFTSLARYSDVYRAGARRFDVGETGVLTLLPGLAAALEQIEAWGIGNIAGSLAAVNQRIADHLEGLGFELPEKSQRCPHMLGARLPAGFRGNLVADLRARDVYISQREQSLRFAPHLWVDDADVERLFEALDALIRR